jgi:hypothetical protein
VSGRSDHIVNLQPIAIIRQANVLAVAEANQVEASPRNDHEALLGLPTRMLQELDEPWHGSPQPQSTMMSRRSQKSRRHQA